MEDVLKKMCEDLIKMLSTLRQAEKITETEFRRHLKEKSKFIESIKS